MARDTLEAGAWSVQYRAVWLAARHTHDTTCPRAQPNGRRSAQAHVALNSTQRGVKGCGVGAIDARAARRLGLGGGSPASWCHVISREGLTASRSRDGETQALVAVRVTWRGRDCPGASLQFL